MGEKDFAALQQEWFRRLTTCGAVTSAGFTALLAGLGLWLEVDLLLVGAAVIGAVFLLALIALALAAAGRILVAAQLLAGAGVAHAVVQSYLFPFAAPALAVSVVLSVASVLPYVQGRPLRWLVVSSIASSLAITSLPRLSPLRDAVPPAAQQLIDLAALPAVTIMTALLLLQFSERIRYTRQAEAIARSDAEQARLALETTSERLRIAVSAAGIGIWDIDLATGRLVMDDRCNAMLGVPAGAPLDYAGFLGLVHADDRQHVHDSISQIVSADCDGRNEIEYRIQEHDGRARWLRSTGQRLADARTFIRVIGTAQDVTADKESERELRAARDKAEDANRAKDEFLAMLGHELRNPLAPMLTALELLRLRLGDAAAREREVIHRQVRNLAQLVDDMLDVAQIRKGRMTLETTSVYARQLVAQACDVVAPMLEERRHRLEIEIEPASLIVVGDERRLVQALTNLLTNAVKYTEPGGSIRISVVEEGETVTVRVRDTGRGIPADFLPRVFDLFVQGERTPDRREGGLGLGLPIVRSIVERHGGTVSAASEGAGKGSEFSIRLPATAGAETPLPAVRPATATPGPSCQKVLIIDDNTDAADSLCALLRDCGFTCASALDGPSGLNMVTTFEPDAILVDLGLPGLDGHEIARRIRAMPGGDRYLTVAITGYGEDRDRRRSEEAGLDAHLVKPVGLEQLLPILRAERVSSARRTCDAS